MDLRPGLTIRPATADDIPALGRVHLQCWREAYAGIVDGAVLAGMDAEGWAGKWSRNFGEGVSGKPELERHFVVEDAGSGVVGFAGAGPSRHGQLKYDGELYGLYVIRSFQGAGIGRALLAAVAGFLSGHRYASMILWVLEGNKPARRFYERLGGNLVGVKTTVKIGGKDHDEVAYSWDSLARLADSLKGK